MSVGQAERLGLSKRRAVRLPARVVALGGVDLFCEADAVRDENIDDILLRLDHVSVTRN